MIGWLRGTILQKIGKNRIILIANNIGYIINLTESRYLLVDDKCQDRAFYIKNLLGESKNEYYGLDEYKQVAAFEELTLVYKLGASAAMKILSVMTPEQIKKNVIENNVAEFKKIKGVGGKMIINIMETLGKKYNK